MAKKTKGIELPTMSALELAYRDKVLIQPEPVLAVTQSEPEQARKYDSGKPDYTLLPKPALDAACRALMYGEQKYERFNYLKGAGLAQHRVLASVFRHLYAHNAGELTDSESGLAHTDHAIAALSMLIHLISEGKGLS